MQLALAASNQSGGIGARAILAGLADVSKPGLNFLTVCNLRKCRWRH